MNKELTKKIVSRFLFYESDFNFECGDGWFQLLWNLSEGIEKELRKKHTVDEFAKSLLSGQPLFYVRQVKEKFGTLRYYYGRLEDDEINNIDEMITIAENKSAETCEVCGNPGKLRSKGWRTVQCDECFNKEKKC